MCYMHVSISHLRGQILNNGGWFLVLSMHGLEKQGKKEKDHVYKTLILSL